MVLLQVIPDREPSRRLEVKEFPFRIGRSGSNDLQLSDRGIWAEHLVLDLDVTSREIFVSASPEALCLVNGERVTQHNLRSGDVVQVGACKILFNLAPARQRGLHLREGFAWALAALVVVAQVLLIFFLNSSSF